MSFAKTQPNVPVETNPAKNEAADQVIAILTDHAEFNESEDSEWGVPKVLLENAGLALANRYCFAVVADDDDSIVVMITPIRYFEERGACSDQSGPVDDLLPPQVGNVSESTWEFYADHIRTPIDAARELQKYGFYWSSKFQDFISANLTKTLSVALLTPAPKPPKGPATF